jgi:hypothetical protein
MHFDIIESVRQKQHKQQQSISIENGDVVDISITNGKVVVGRGAPAELKPEDEVVPADALDG